jgi:hypothetical protein
VGSLAKETTRQAHLAKEFPRFQRPQPLIWVLTGEGGGTAGLGPWLCVSVSLTHSHTSLSLLCIITGTITLPHDLPDWFCLLAFTSCLAKHYVRRFSTWLTPRRACSFRRLGHAALRTPYVQTDLAHSNATSDLINHSHIYTDRDKAGRIRLVSSWLQYASGIDASGDLRSMFPSPRGWESRQADVDGTENSPRDIGPIPEHRNIRRSLRRPTRSQHCAVSPENFLAHAASPLSAWSRCTLGYARYLPWIDQFIFIAVATRPGGQHTTCGHSPEAWDVQCRTGDDQRILPTPES